MSYKKSIRPTNDKGQPHGYWKCHYDGKLWYEGNFINGKIWYEGNFINGKEDGMWLWYLPNGKNFDKTYNI